MSDKPPPNPDDDSQRPRRGRPTLLTEEKALGVALSILDGNFRYVAGKRYGITPGRFKRWMRQGKAFPDGLYGTFRSLVLEAEAEAERLAVQRVLQSGKEEDAKHLEWWLERKFPQRWSRYRGELVELKRRIKELERMVQGETADPQIDPPY